MLVTLVSVHPSPSPQSVPLAAALLKSSAGDNLVTIDLADFFLGADIAQCADKLTAPQPNVVGFSIYVWNRNFCCELAAELRRRHPGIRLLCGGPEVTADPGSILQANLFDYVIVGEGELPFSALCNSLARGEFSPGIPGLLYPGSDLQAPPVPVADLDTIPSPYLTGIIDTRTFPGILWQLSRGCSFTCDFCFDARGVHGVRQFSLERLTAELKHFAATGVNQVFVLDSTFNLDRERAKKILKMISRFAPNIHFHFEARSEFIDREMARLFAEIPCSIQIGLQSANREALKLVSRTFNKADFSAKIGMLNDSGAVFGFDLIYGLPGDTSAGFKNSLDYALSLYPNHLDIFPLAVLPGTRLASHGHALNLQWDPNPPYILQHTDRFTAADMAEAAGMAAACDILYTRGKAVAWFNAICAALGVKPSELLQMFSVWLADTSTAHLHEADFSDAEVMTLQQDFINRVFTEKKVGHFLPLVLDLVRYHQQYAAVLLAPEDMTGTITPTGFTGSTQLRLASSARLIRFSYDIEELLDCGEPRIAWMHSHLQRSGSRTVMYRNNGAVYTESLAEPYMLLLEQIRDGNGITGTCGTGLDHNETAEFLAFACGEGILVSTG